MVRMREYGPKGEGPKTRSDDQVSGNCTITDADVTNEDLEAALALALKRESDW